MAEYDADYPAERRSVSMWVEDGVQHRCNTMGFDGYCPLHSHAFPHLLTIKRNPFMVKMRSPDGQFKCIEVKAGAEFKVPAYWLHTLIPLPADNLKGLWIFDCTYPEIVNA